MHENGIRATRKVDPAVWNLWLLEPYGNEAKIAKCNCDHVLGKYEELPQFS